MAPTTILTAACRFLPLAVVALLVACGSAPTKEPETGMVPAPTVSALTVSPSSRYYKDDGPGVAPANLDAIPDAVPRMEPLHRFANRPYTVLGRDYVPATTLRPYRERGIASWYGRKFHGEKTSTGETYDMYAMTAAHPTLPLPSYAKVTNVATGKSVVVRVNDRGPFLHGRVIDLSYAAAERIGIAQKGSGEVEVEALLPARHPDACGHRSAASDCRAGNDDGGKGPPASGGRCIGPGRAPRGRIRRAAGRLRKFCQCPEFRRAPREPDRPDRGRSERAPGQRAVPRLRRALFDA